MKNILILLMLPLLFSCGQKQPQCASEGTKKAVFQKLKSKQTDSGVIEKLQLSDIRTAKIEEDIQKRSCKATLKVKMKNTDEQSMPFSYSVQFNSEGKLHIDIINHGDF